MVDYKSLDRLIIVRPREWSWPCSTPEGETWAIVARERMKGDMVTHISVQFSPRSPYGACGASLGPSAPGLWIA